MHLFFREGQREGACDTEVPRWRDSRERVGRIQVRKGFPGGSGSAAQTRVPRSVCVCIKESAYVSKCEGVCVCEGACERLRMFECEIV